MSVSVLAAKRDPAAAGNWRKGRTWLEHSRGDVDMIVVHVTEGSAPSVREWFNDPAAQVTAHYLVPIASGVEWFVDEDDTAYHAGQLVTPSSALVRERYAAGGYTPNSYGIGIEHEGDGQHELTNGQRSRSVALIADICSRRKIPADRVHILGHHEIKASKTCPGAISVDRLVADVRAALSGPVAVELEPSPALFAPGVVAVLSPTLGALVVVTAKSDTNWTFVRVDELRVAIAAGAPVKTYAAGTRLSSLRAYALRPT